MRLKDWKMKPMRRLRSSASSSKSLSPIAWPSMVQVPAVGRSRHPMMLSSVVFPEPLGPITTVNSPGSTSRSTPRSAGTTVRPRR